MVARNVGFSCSKQKVRKSSVISLLTVIIISVIVLFWLFMYLFVRKLIRRIETPVEEPAKKKRKRGKYVKVTEIEKKKTEKTDLDSLLEEKGLKEKKKK